jgi:phage shock protein PspC (stress-responsive transcriptional regulator)
MQKVITINLNGNAYQLDESGYDALHQYLGAAERALAGNPDRVEIMADLEQAIADKCQKFLAANKSVVSGVEIEQIVKEMGPIEPTDDEAAEGGGKGAGDGQQPAAGAARPKRLYRIPNGAMAGGICNGVAAYFGIDVTLVRIGFVIIAVITKGAGILAYVVMMFVIPEAKTGEEQAAAGGEPFNAKEVIDRAKKQYAEGTRHWRRQWRQQQRHWRRYGWAGGAHPPYGGRPAGMPLPPVLALFHFALFVTVAAMTIALVNTGAILDWHLPADIPTWAGVLGLLVAYQFIVSPIRAAHRWSWPSYSEGQAGWYAFWNAVIWLLGLAFVFWVTSDHLPEIREFLQRMPEVAREFAEDMRDFFSRQPR